jgi:Leucine-rich repeat (LRR) protein
MQSDKFKKAQFRLKLYQKIPKEISNLLNLETFTITNNLIEHLPEEIAQLNKLNILHIQQEHRFNAPDNPLLSIPQAILDMQQKQGLCIIADKEFLS